MEKIQQTTNNDHKPGTNYAESRRDTRKRLEKGISEASADHAQLNNVMLAIMVIIASVVSFTDFRLSFGEVKKLTALAIFLYIITSLVYKNRYTRGKLRGRNDIEYREALLEYREKRKGIYDNLVAGFVPEFCRYYKAHELREYREGLLADVEIEYSEYAEKYRRLRLIDVLMLKLPYDMKMAIIKCNRAKPLRLTAGLILNENGEMDRDHLVGQSGREREKKDMRTQKLTRAISVLFGAAVVVDIIFNFSPIVIIQWCVRMLPIIASIPLGDDAGYCCVTVTETNFKKDQTKIIRIFDEYIKKKHETTNNNKT